MLYRAGPSAVGETGGAFRLTGAAGLTGPGLYQAAGVFLGRRN
jgi:hypothetical protein